MWSTERILLTLGVFVLSVALILLLDNADFEYSLCLKVINFFYSCLVPNYTDIEVMSGSDNEEISNVYILRKITAA